MVMKPGLSPQWLLLASVLFCSADIAAAFQEDVCPDGAGGWRDCIVNPCAPGSEATFCGVSAAVSALSSTFLTPLTGKGARSTIHTDATYLLAQAAGFSARDAYVVAIYDAATDMGQYVHRDQHGGLAVDPQDCIGGAPRTDCWLLSQTIGGVVRNNFRDGGLFFHFMASAHVESAGEGLAPAVSDAQREPFLHSLKRWAYDGGPLCVAGLADAARSGCFASAARATSSLAGRMPYESEGGALASVDWVSTIAEQKIATDPVSGVNTPASALANYVAAEDLPLARLGIYLHALADRISHYRCIDASDVDGPRAADAGAVVLNPLMDLLYQTALHLATLPSYLQSLQPTPLVHDPDFLFVYDTQECDQSNHFLRHSWETGHDHGTLAPGQQTTAHGLRAVFDELIRYAAAHRLPRAQALDEVQREAVIDAILEATDTAGAQARIDALTALAERRGWLPLPLHGDLDAPAWQQRAGKAMFGADDGASDIDGAGAFGGLTLLLLGVLLRRRTYRAQS